MSMLISAGSEEERELMSWLRKGRVEARVFAAEQSRMTDSLIRVLADDESSRVRSALAQNKQHSFPEDVLLKLAGDEGILVRFAVAERPDITDEVCRLLVDDSEETVKTALGGNPKTSADVLARLAEEGEPDTRVQVAGNTCTPAEVLSHFVREGSYLEVVTAAGNSNLPADVLENLCESDDRQVLNSVALNPSSSFELRLLSGLRVFHVDDFEVAELLDYPGLGVELLERAGALPGLPVASLCRVVELLRKHEKYADAPPEWVEAVLQG